MADKQSRQYLFLFTITDVQNFIKQSRKAQDLFAGSQMLADWIDAAVKAFNEKGGKLIFPHPDTAMKTNRFLGTIEPEQELEVIGQAIEGAIKDKVRKEARKSFYKAFELEEKDLPAGTTEQIKDLIDIRWAFRPYGEGENYKDAHFNLERTIAALKQVRFTPQLNYQQDNKGNPISGERGRKCSVDGQRNVKFYRLNESEKNKLINIKADELLKHLENNKLYAKPGEDVIIIVDKNTLKKQDLNDDNRFLAMNKYDLIAEGEGLSAVSMFKRCYPELKRNEAYPDTAQIAMLDNIYKAKTEGKNKSLNKLCQYRNLFKGQLDPIVNRCMENQLSVQPNDGREPFDFEYLFEENLWKIPSEVKNAKSVHGELKNAFEADNIPFLSSYALLSFDGDNIGKWLAGDAVTDTKAFHDALAQNLKNFADKAEKIFTRKRGRIIYNGGDDFLAMVTLPALFEVIEAIRDASAEISPNLQSFFKNPDAKLTLSFGVTVAHYKTPLHKVLDYTRDTLKQAKKRYEKPTSMFEYPKNAFGISVLSTSSLVAQYFCKLHEWPYLKSLISHLSSDNGEEGKLSNKFMFTFLREFAQVLTEEMTYAGYQTTLAAARSELQRLMERNGGKLKNNEELKALYNDLTQVLLNQAEKKAPNTYTLDYDNLRGFMKTAEQLKRTNAFEQQNLNLESET